jgi:hypothetical protein
MTTTSEELVNKQNVTLQYQLRKIKDKYSTYDKKNYYEGQKITNAKYYFNMLFVIYYILAVVVLWFLYKSTKFTIYMKLFLAIVLGAYPFVISTIEFFVFELLYYLYALIFSIPYKSDMIVNA